MTSARGTAFCHPLSVLMEFQSPNNPPSPPPPRKQNSRSSLRPSFHIYGFYPRTVPSGAPFLKKANVCVWLWPFVAHHRCRPRISHCCSTPSPMASPNIGLLKVSPMCSACVYYIIVYTNDDGDGDGETTTTAVAAVVEDCGRGPRWGRGQKVKRINFPWRNLFAVLYNG